MALKRKGRGRHGQAIVELAKRLNRLRREIDARDPTKRLKIDAAFSRILQNDPAYKASRPLSAEPRLTSEPSVFTVKAVTDHMGVPICAAFGQEGHVFPRSTGDKLIEAARLIIDTFGQPQQDAAASLPAASFPVLPSRFIEHEYDYPRPYHAATAPLKSAAAGKSGIEAEFEVANVLHSTRGLTSSRVFVIKVIGDSMADLIKDGNKVLVDTSLVDPRDGDVVAVYRRDEGGVIGYWRVDGTHFSIEKHNRGFPSIPLHDPDEFTVWGTVTTIVEAALGRRRR